MSSVIFSVHHLENSSAGVRDTAEKNIEERCAVNINKFVSNKLRVHNQSSLSELFISFLTKVTLECNYIV